ncbi:MAG TPA: diguanylate cyclase, partial [Thermoanaerobaculia bacterium]|nr:diguanylate cyclase [Thermoanaerobaculia bacterium]
MSLAAAQGPIAATARLLVVEDDEQSAFLIGELVRADGNFDVLYARTLADACDVVDAGKADVILLDLGLPDANELDSLTRLKDCVTEIPIIVLTGRNDESLAVEALHRGAEDYLVKGEVDAEAVLRAIRYAMERHRSVRELARVTRELQAANATLERLTLLDPLTDLLNRRGLQQALSREISRLRREETLVLIALVDIDDFKRVNEKLGHAVGDIALKETADRLRFAVRATDYVGRFGGDEFLLLLPDAAASEVSKIAERVRLAISTTTISHAGETMRMTASLGVALLTPDTPSIDEVIARMQQLLRRSKSEGKDRVSYDNDRFDDSSVRHHRQTDMCTDLVNGRRLVTVQHPIYRLSDETTIGYEFLSRYHRGRTEMPETFFRLCSERNVLTLVDHQCLRSALQRAREVAPGSRLHVNLFPTTMLSVPTEHLLEEFDGAFPRGSCCVEISEQQIIGNPGHLAAPVKALREAGLLIAIDDVGFGNSCLESLIVLEPDVIKLDKRCVIGLRSGDIRLDHLSRYLQLARTLGAEVIAEGIETAEELELVRDLGI